MTKDDTFELLEFVLTTALLRQYPIDRQLLRSNVRAALLTLHSGLQTAYVCGITGEINECRNVYDVRVP